MIKCSWTTRNIPEEKHPCPTHYCRAAPTPQEQSLDSKAEGSSGMPKGFHKEKSTLHLHFCGVLVAACHGSRVGRSHLLHLDSLGTGLEEGKMSIVAATARNQSSLVPCSPSREPFSQKARAGGNWKLQFLF